ncbi:MAG TPA: ABC transporter ATP-binding protein, partial [Elusimicrobia bacterium]|nr:ABC transporter ATP-binding protein [Elusimicrobiota bacterium]
MSDIVIKAENLSKSYIIGHLSNERYVALRDILTNKTREWWSRIRNPHFHTHRNIEEIWALKDISFEVKQGERIGIIGRNGAGKSTLLKVLSRITEPTTGRVKIKGRVASLLEVGTGFHPELTGRENIYLNGAILGMTREDVKRKFDGIVAFAEIEKFLDTPVKRYSSGMYVRLAFAVAAHLEPEILLVDEVLAVGDAQFQKKCLGKMDEVAKEGRTVLFVSHAMKAIEMLCNRVILLEEGKIAREDNPSEVVRYYLGEGKNQESINNDADFQFPDDPNKPAHINRLRIFNNRGELSTKHDIMNPVRIIVDFELRINYPTLFVECVFHRVGGFSENYGHGSFLTTSADWINYQKQKENKNMIKVFPMERGKYSTTINLLAPFFNAGIYEMEIYLTTGPSRQDTCKSIFFQIIDTGSFVSIVRSAQRSGFLAYPIEWIIK